MPTNVLLSGCSADEEGEFVVARQRMVRRQLVGRDITNQNVLRSMAAVPRHEFVPASQRSQAYSDHPLPIGYGQTISQPYIVAFMTQALDLGSDDVVLEVGSGSGYQAAVLAGLVSQVYTVEIVEPLALQARAVLRRLAYLNVQVQVGDGYRGWASQAPFDAIIVTCAPAHLPQPLIDQLKEGGRMIIPVGPSYDQSLYLLRKVGGQIQQQAVMPVRFVPMMGKAWEANSNPL